METICKKIKTRKTHSCVGCCGAIPKGTESFYITTFDDGTVTHDYMCKVCNAVACDPNGLDGEDFFDGEVRDSFPELWGKYKKRIEEGLESA